MSIDYGRDSENLFIRPFIAYEIAVADFLSIRKKCLDERMSDKAAPAKDVILHKIALL